MNLDWLAKAFKETVLEVLRYLFVWNKQGDAASPDESDAKLKDQVKKDGW